jgi:hypothetical protein
MTETNFQEEWLDIRYPFDTAARNPKVHAQFEDHFFGYDQLRLWDIGSGTGNNFRYWFTKLVMPQTWSFIELNEELGKRSIEKVKEYVNAEKRWKTYEVEGILKFAKIEPNFNPVTPLDTITVGCRKQSFLEIPFGKEGLLHPDVLLANAVFDLLTPEMFEEFAGKLIDHKIPLLSTINFEGMEFEDGTYQDKYYTNCYIQHMNRIQDYGRTLGSDCNEFAKSFYEKRGIKHIFGQSNWQIKETDSALLLATLNYMSEAVPEMLPNDQEKHHFQDWLADKRRQVHEKKVRLIVYHYDWFVCP